MRFRTFRSKLPGRIFFSLMATSLILLEFACNKDKPTPETPEIQPIVSTPKTRRAAATRFEQNLPEIVPLPTDEDIVAKRVLKEYGAIFVARAVPVPPKIVFESGKDCAAWQRSVPVQTANFGVNIELQKPAMEALLAARDEARQKGFNFTAHGTWAARRDYNDTVKIWATRITPGLNYWTARGKISESEAARIRQLQPSAQIAEILRLEEQKIYFSKDFSKSVLYSATPPGASQHLSMLAVDINENGNAAVREVLARHGWFQTVASDLPHFTLSWSCGKRIARAWIKKDTSGRQSLLDSRAIGS